MSEFVNPMNGTNTIENAVAKLKEQRTANEPEPVESESTGGTEEAMPQNPAEDVQEVHAEAERVEEVSEPEHSAEESDRYIVKVGGEEIEVSLDELRSGYMMHSDYTKKTMAHADTVKEFEAKQAQFDAERMTKLQELESFIESQEQNIDWDTLRDTDPEEFIKQKELQEQRKAAAAKERDELEEKQLAQLEQYTSEQAAKLEELMGPTWTPEKRSQDFEQAAEYLKSMGVSEEEMSGLRDARFWLMIFDAMNYKSISKTKDYVKNEVKKAPKTVKPGHSKVTPKDSELSQLKANLQASNKVNTIDNAVALLKAKRGK